MGLKRGERMKVAGPDTICWTCAREPLDLYSKPNLVLWDCREGSIGKAFPKNGPSMNLWMFLLPNTRGMLSRSEKITRIEI